MNQHHRREDRVFPYIVLAVIFLMFCLVLEAMAHGNPKPEVLTVLGSGLGVVIGMVSVVVAHLWSTQKKQDTPADRTQDSNTASIEIKTIEPVPAAPEVQK